MQHTVTLRLNAMNGIYSAHNYDGICLDRLLVLNILFDK